MSDVKTDDLDETADLPEDAIDDEALDSVSGGNLHRVADNEHVTLER